MYLYNVLFAFNLWVDLVFFCFLMLSGLSELLEQLAYFWDKSRTFGTTRPDSTMHNGKHFQKIPVQFLYFIELEKLNRYNVKMISIMYGWIKVQTMMSVGNYFPKVKRYVFAAITVP